CNLFNWFLGCLLLFYFVFSFLSTFLFADNCMLTDLHVVKLLGLFDDLNVSINRILLRYYRGAQF
ncbi:hypothetical protein ACJX0J_006993, partial [Zea mays]